MTPPPDRAWLAARERAERASTSAHARRLGDRLDAAIVEPTKELVRKHPALTLGGAAAVGLLFGRALAPRRERASPAPREEAPAERNSSSSENGATAPFLGMTLGGLTNLALRTLRVGLETYRNAPRRPRAAEEAPAAAAAATTSFEDGNAAAPPVAAEPEDSPPVFE